MRQNLEMTGMTQGSEASLPAAPAAGAVPGPIFLREPPKPRKGLKPLAYGLGLLSLGLGLAAVSAPRKIAHLVGVRSRHRGLIRAMGVREIGHGLLILFQPKKPVLGVWSRLAGDAL